MPVRKRFGQHFLHDRAVIDRIVKAIDPQPGDRVIEIGPGRGALTFALLAKLPRLEAIEIDRDLAARVAGDPRGAGKLDLRVGDALRTDFLALRGDGAPLRIVGNLPYNISTPLLFRLIDQRRAILDVHAMLQKEVVDRITATADSSDYGRLTVMLAAFAATERLFDVGPGAFQPPPRVWSSVVRLRTSEAPRFEIGDPSAYGRIVAAAFSHRRKTLRNALRGLLEPAEIEGCGIDPGARPGTLTPERFGQLARHLRSREHAAADGPAARG
jgi:16S rRNA (adenine1518-N6/adenine1519-N6)-dimethyltransferase